HRDCFACHHQTVPLAAMREARRMGLKVDEELFDDTVKFVRRYFEGRLDELEQGRGIPGRAFMVGYGAWAFELSEVNMPHDLRRAMAQYVIWRQEPDGHWTPAAIRPPAEQSEVTNTVLAMRVLRPVGNGTPFDLDPEWSVTADQAERRARRWLTAAPTKLQEDVVFRLWGLSWFGDESQSRDGVVRKIVERQQPDGGWAAEEGLKSEAYSTGITLFALLDTGESPTSLPIARGLEYLARTQQADGSWFVATRAKPVQAFFDNGDPHGKNQFISISATGWSVAAIARAVADSEARKEPTR
ncbi:MAG TPA: prenyltransferase/squalene oxidase repeat-containing protein, partial [Planctomycetaceae bacterium]|nr:prenyltransferase/squalene oxidase repeat-containing protein [Planctomycetaceae bacterium]